MPTFEPDFEIVPRADGSGTFLAHVTGQEAEYLRKIRNGTLEVRDPRDEPERKIEFNVKVVDTDPLTAYLRRQREWSLRTFGPGFRTDGVLNHIRKELGEVEKEPHDLMEWIDIVILAFDGFWRHGGSPERVMMLLQKKQDKNFARNWPDWRERSEDQAIEHDRSAENTDKALDLI